MSHLKFCLCWLYISYCMLICLYFSHTHKDLYTARSKDSRSVDWWWSQSCQRSHSWCHWMYVKFILHILYFSLCKYFLFFTTNDAWTNLVFFSNHYYIPKISILFKWVNEKNRIRKLSLNKPKYREFVSYLLSVISNLCFFFLRYLQHYITKDLSTLMSLLKITI